MAMRARDLWTWRDTIGRRDYALWGFGLLVVKYNLDRILLTQFAIKPWMPWSYLLATPAARISGPVDFRPAAALLALSLPFIYAGVVMTLRRLRDLGWRPWLVFLFFVPFVNLLFFLLLCLQPAAVPPDPEPRARHRWFRWFRIENSLGAAALGVLAGTLLGLALAAFCTVVLKNYGWSLFVGTPFMMGLCSALFYASIRPRRWFECAGVALLSVGLVGALFVALAFEGIICVLMAAPIAGALAVLGATIGYWIQSERWSTPLGQTRLYAAAWIALPVLMTVEARQPAPAPLMAATTVCEVAAPPAAVWRHVVAFGDLPPPTEKVFLAGIAYPVRARLEGRGVGAVRYCEFSTGPFVEPITAWDENRRLAFDVMRQPHPMREWSPYSHLQPAHLEGFFRSRRGEFRLIALSGGRTRLEGTTWYEQAIWPQSYWRPWSDHLIHTIHLRVLEHIKAETERELR